MRILVVEDDEKVAALIRSVLQRSEYVVDVAADGEEGQFLGETEPYDAIVLDLGLPLINGLGVLEAWRRGGIKTPVLILSARDTWREKVSGLRTGADDYLAKPFEAEELMARVEALIRRSTGNPTPIIQCGPIEWDTYSGSIRFEGEVVQMTNLEYKVMTYMLHHRGKVISKTEFTEHIYPYEYDRDFNVIEVLISRLRKKFGGGMIETLRGRGYRLTETHDDEGNA